MHESRSTLHWVPHGWIVGESMADMCVRLQMFLQQLRDTSSGLRVLVVCHGQVMRAFQALLEVVVLIRSAEVVLIALRSAGSS